MGIKLKHFKPKELNMSIYALSQHPEVTSNKYFHWYQAIIEKAQSDTTRSKRNGTYYEEHHIFPQCDTMGGEEHAKIKSNLVLLTAREHFVVHRFLTKFTSGKAKVSMRHAIWKIIICLDEEKLGRKIGSREYARRSEESSKNHSEWHKNMTPEEQEEYSVKLSAGAKKYWDGLTTYERVEHSARQSAGQKKRWDDTTPDELAEHGENVSAGLAKRTPEEKAASIEKSNAKKAAKPDLPCPHCDQIYRLQRVF